MDRTPCHVGLLYPFRYTDCDTVESAPVGYLAGACCGNDGGVWDLSAVIGWNLYPFGKDEAQPEKKAPAGQN